MSHEIISKDSTEVIGFDFPTSLEETITKIAKDEGYTNYTVKRKMLPTDGNFIAFLYEVDIIGEIAGSVKETSLFIKKSVTFDKITLASVPDLYRRELFVYNDLSKMFSKLQDEANVPEKERYKIVKSYNSNEDMIIMENLAKKGFYTYHRTQVISNKFAELSVIELAKFHALSFVIKEKMPRYFDDKIRSIKSALNLQDDWQGLINNACVTASKVLTGDVKTKIENYAPRLCKLYKKYLQDVIPKHGCLCHGDYKMLNILVRDIDGVASEVVPIDYQLMYFGCPVDDFFFFLFTGTDREFRRKHLNNLKDLYFETLAGFLKYFDMDANSTYSRESFEADYLERFELGLVFGLYLAVFTFAHVEEGFDVSKLSLSELPVIPDEMFGDRDLRFETSATFFKYFDMDANSTYSRESFEADYLERFELGLVFGLYLAVFTFAHVEEGFDVSKLSLSELPVIPDEMFGDRVRGIVDDYIEWGYL